MSMDQHKVFRVQYTLALRDPDVPYTEYHTVLFVESSPKTGDGTIYHVSGDITSRSGMHYQSKPGKRPEDSETYYGKRLLGMTNAAPERWHEILRDVKRPPQQKEYNVKRKRTEPFKTLHPLTFYDEGEPRLSLSKCTEWVDLEAIPTLLRAGLIQSPLENTQ